ncbi:MAG: diacylglycerol kinase family protein [Candidatus Omnitrophota bacterium]
MKTLAIISNKKRFPRKARIINFLKKYQRAEVRFIENFSDIPGIIRDNKDAESVICCGGDGTISEVINNMDLETQNLGVIPYGRGNGFARTLWANSPSRALKAIKKGSTRVVDLIACEYVQKGETFARYAVSTAGLGRIALSAQDANKNARKSYIFTSIRAALNKNELEGELLIGENTSKTLQFSNLIVNNTPYIGNFYAFPKGDIHDSLMDFNITRINSLEQVLVTFIVLCKLHLYTKKHHPLTVHGQTHKLGLKLKKPAMLMLDGEVFGPVEEVKFSILPGALKVYAIYKNSDKDLF